MAVTTLAPNVSEEALRLFCSRVEQIPGVVSVDRYCVEASGDAGIRVIVANLFSQITHDVIQAQEQIYDAMPGVRFQLDIKDASIMRSGEN